MMAADVENVSEKDSATRLNRSNMSRLWLLVSCLLVALILAVVIGALRPASEESADQQLAAPANRAADRSTVAAPSPQRIPLSRTASPPATSSVTLPKAQVPVNVDLLEQETRETANELLKSYPELPEAVHVAAMMHAQMRETDRAAVLWKKCVVMAPESKRYRVNLATVAMERGDNRLAAETLKALVERGSQSADVLHHLGLALINIGEADEAEAVLRQAVSAYPQSAAHWMALGQAQLKQDVLDQAVESFERANQLGIESPDLYFHLASAHRRLNNPEKAAEYQTRFQELKKSAPMAAQDRFQILSSAEARSTAVTILVEAATVHARQNDSLRAELQLLRAIALQPGNVTACKLLADLYQNEGALPEEQTVRERLVTLQPFRFDNHLALAKVASQQGQRDLAEASLKLALVQQPDAAIGYIALAEFYHEGRMLSKARWYAQEVARRFPSPEGYQFLAKICRLMGDDASAAQAVRAAEKLQADRSSASPSLSSQNTTAPSQP